MLGIVPRTASPGLRELAGDIPQHGQTAGIDPQVDNVYHKSFAHIQELAIVPAIAPRLRRRYM